MILASCKRLYDYGSNHHAIHGKIHELSMAVFSSRRLKSTRGYSAKKGEMRIQPAIIVMGFD